MLDLFYDGIYSELFPNCLFSRPAKTVRHQQTCPECGRTLVNLYEKEPHVWMCKACRDRKEGDMK